MERNAGKATEVEGVRVLDDYTLRISLTAARTYFLAKLTYPVSYVVDREQIVANPQNWARSPNGTGPFKLANWTLNERLILEANSDYHGGAPRLASTSADVAGKYARAEVDVITSLTTETRGAIPDAEVRTSPRLSTSYIAFNTAAPPFDDLKVRQAFSMAVDRSRLAEALNYGYPEANSILPPGMPGFNPNLRALSFDANRAKQLLQESTYGTAAPSPKSHSG
jgi:ABC-type oligopeptide transport system substrate-binding subunit